MTTKAQTKKRADLIQANRERILVYLANRHPPPWGDVATKELGMKDSAWWGAVNMCSWFTPFGVGKCGWRLTAEGEWELRRRK